MTGWKNDTAAAASILIDNDRALLDALKGKMLYDAETFALKGHDVFTGDEYVRFGLEDWLKITLIDEPTEHLEDCAVRQDMLERARLAIQTFAEDCDFSELARHYMDMAKEDE